MLGELSLKDIADKHAARVAHARRNLERCQQSGDQESIAQAERALECASLAHALLVREYERA